MNFADLTPEQQEKARACKTPEDVLALAKAEAMRSLTRSWTPFRAASSGETS